jgi:methylthioribose-1-phosphate isomerase
LTAFELKQDKIPVTLITDTMVGYTMQNRMVSKVIVGADRILATGHVINKIGTLAVAILANHFRIPFYAAAPHSSFDLKAKPDEVVIEERDPGEVAFVDDYRIAPEGVQILNPAFDMTEPKMITGIITDLGVIHQPLEEKIVRLLGTRR